MERRCLAIRRLALLTANKLWPFERQTEIRSTLAADGGRYKGGDAYVAEGENLESYRSGV